MERQPNSRQNEKKPQSRRLRSKSIKTKFLVGIISLTAAISLICGVVNAMLMYRDATEHAETRLNENRAAYTESIRNAVDVLKTRIEAITRDAELADMSLTNKQRNQLMADLAAQNGFVTLAIASPDGNTSDGAQVSEREYFQKSVKGETFISSTLVSKATGLTVLVVSAQINFDGYMGAAIATLSSDTFSKMVDNIHVGDSGYGFIVDKQGKIIAHPNRELVNQQVNYIELAKDNEAYSEMSAVVQEMTAGKTGIMHATLDGEDLMFSYSSIPGTDGWSIAVEAKTSEMMQSFYTSSLIAIVLTVLSIVVSVLVAFRITAPIIRPIVKLVGRIRMLTEGDLHSEVPIVKSGDEIETLSNSFADTIASLNAYIGEITHILTSLEQGDCTVRTQQEYQGDFVKIKESLNNIVGNLNRTFTSIRESANQVAAGSDQVSYGAQALASGSTEQAAAVEELNAFIAEIAERAEENAAYVDNASEHFAQAVDGVNIGNEHMGQLTEAMFEIGSASSQIVNITKVIEDIAFQTNILALNAAIEAARAGSAGKGFAVVADEVRNLAAKSAEAAHQTADLIQASVFTVERGQEITAKTAQVLQSVGESANKMTKSFTSIAQASAQQTEAIEHIDQGLSQVSSVVQANAATAQESSASSQELTAQAHTLQQEVQKFKLGGEDRQQASHTFAPPSQRQSASQNFGKY